MNDAAYGAFVFCLGIGGLCLVLAIGGWIGEQVDKWLRKKKKRPAGREVPTERKDKIIQPECTTRLEEMQDV